MFRLDKFVDYVFLEIMHENGFGHGGYEYIECNSDGILSIIRDRDYIIQKAEKFKCVITEVQLNKIINRVSEYIRLH